MCCCRASDIPHAQSFAQSCDNTVLPISTMNIGEHDIVFLVFSEKTIELGWYIIDITCMRRLCYETLESFATSEADRTFGGDTTSEEGNTHFLLLFRRRIDDRSIHEFIDIVLFDIVTGFFPNITVRKSIKIYF